MNTKHTTMTEMEQKCLIAQIELLKGISDADNMIIHIVQSTASQLLNDVIDKVYIKSDQKTVELTTEDFTKIRLVLAHLSSDDGFCKMNGWIKESYINPKKEKKKILSMLQ